MPTRKQIRSETRIKQAKERKARRFKDFAYKVARRRLHGGDRRDLRIGLHCMPGRLGMSIDELMSHGEQICGGQAALFRRGELKRLIRRGWTCQSRGKPAILFRKYLMYYYYEDDGTARDRYAADFDTTLQGWA